MNGAWQYYWAPWPAPAPVPVSDVVQGHRAGPVTNPSAHRAGPITNPAAHRAGPITTTLTPGRGGPIKPGS